MLICICEHIHKAIINSPDFDRSKALEQQIELLRLKKEHIENLMNFALGIKLLGVKHMDFKAFDRRKLDEYSRQAKELYGNMPEYKEMEEKQKNRTEEDERIIADRFMLLFKEAGEMKNIDPASADAQNLVKRIQDYITENLYTCTNNILALNRTGVNPKCRGLMYHKSFIAGFLSFLTAYEAKIYAILPFDIAVSLC